MSTVDIQIRSILEAVGFIKSVKIGDTLQGTVWRCFQKSTNKTVVIKVTDRYLHKNHINTHNAKVHENIAKEISILKQLSVDKQCPKSIIKYIGAFKTTSHYFLAMEDGGGSLFSFIEKAHGCITNGTLDIAEWHKMVKIILKQMIESIQYIHSKNISHFDISLENFLINNVDVIVSDAHDKIQFVTDSVQIKLCDFGLAHVFSDSNFESDKLCGKTQYQSPEIRLKQTFSAKSNDIWCLTICFFMMIFGIAPWTMAHKSDERYVQMMSGKRDIIALLRSCNLLHYVNDDILNIFVSVFKFEDQRACLNELERCEWLVR